MPVLETVALAVDEALIARYAALTDDYNPLHVDPAFAAASPFGGIIAHGTMSLNLIWQSVAATFGPDAVRDATLDIRFVKPVRIGDTVHAGGEAVDGSYDVWIRNQADEDVIRGRLTLAGTGG